MREGCNTPNILPLVSESLFHSVKRYVGLLMQFQKARRKQNY